MAGNTPRKGVVDQCCNKLTPLSKQPNDLFGDKAKKSSGVAFKVR